jgi:hypothetical protein
MVHLVTVNVGVSLLEALPQMGCADCRIRSLAGRDNEGSVFPVNATILRKNPDIGKGRKAVFDESRAATLLRDYL